MPIKLLHEATGHICTVRGASVAAGAFCWTCPPRPRRPRAACRFGQGSTPQPLLGSSSLTTTAALMVQVELKSGEIYRGELEEAEDNWNVQLSKVTATARDGKITHMEHIFIRGSRVRFIIVPDMLKNAPMVRAWAGQWGWRGLAVLSNQPSMGRPCPPCRLWHA